MILSPQAPAPVAQSVERPLRRTGSHGFDPGPRHIKVGIMVLAAEKLLKAKLNQKKQTNKQTNKQKIIQQAPEGPIPDGNMCVYKSVYMMQSLSLDILWVGS